MPNRLLCHFMHFYNNTHISATVNAKNPKYIVCLPNFCNFAVGLPRCGS